MSSTLILNTQPLPRYINSSYRQFLDQELHVTRTCPFYVLIFMLQGHLYFSESGQPITLEAGEWYLQEPHLLQEGKRPSPKPFYYYIHFDATSSTTAQQVIHIPKRGQFLSSTLTPSFQILEDYQNQFIWDSLGRQSLFLDLLNQLVHYERADSMKKYPFIQSLIHHIHTHYMEDLSLQELAKIYHFTPDYLIRKMKSVTGYTPHQYLTHVRLEHGKSLLENTNYTIAFIAEAIGYQDISVFYKAFKQQEGLAPGQWRKHR